MCCFLIAVSGPPVRGIGAKRMRGHSGKSAAPRERQLCGPEALLVAVLDVRLRLGSRLLPALLRGGALIWPHFRSVKRADGRAADGIFTAAWFRFAPGDGDAARARIRELLARRLESQPLDQPNAGSVFRNPPGDHAARLIESAGLKGFSIGGARVSDKHANFIVNAERQASAADIERLIERVQQVVATRTGVTLEREVRIIGDVA